jgi:hypothetical protein
MPDEQGRPTVKELQAHSASLQLVIEEARELQTAITDELRRLRRANHTPPARQVERRKTSR